MITFSYFNWSASFIKTPKKGINRRTSDSTKVNNRRQRTKEINFTQNCTNESVNTSQVWAGVSSPSPSSHSITYAKSSSQDKMVSTCVLSLITCHLFNKGFKGEFIDSIIVRLQQDQKVTGVSPVKVFSVENQQLLQVNLNLLYFFSFTFYDHPTEF